MNKKQDNSNKKRRFWWKVYAFLCLFTLVNWLIFSTINFDNPVNIEQTILFPFFAFSGAFLLLLFFPLRYLPLPFYIWLDQLDFSFIKNNFLLNNILVTAIFLFFIVTFYFIILRAIVWGLKKLWETTHTTSTLLQNPKK